MWRDVEIIRESVVRKREHDRFGTTSARLTGRRFFKGPEVSDEVMVYFSKSLFFYRMTCLCVSGNLG